MELNNACLTIISKLNPSCFLLPDELQLYEPCFTTRPAWGGGDTSQAPPGSKTKSPFERN